MTTRFALRRHDGREYLRRWGVEWNRLGGIFVHRMSAPDPGFDVHDHGWWFASLILRGGYTERRCDARYPRVEKQRRRKVGSVAVTRLDEAHHIERLAGPTSWSLVVHGPKVRLWGFYVRESNGAYRWVSHEAYSVGYPERRRLFTESAK